MHVALYIIGSFNYYLWSESGTIVLSPKENKSDFDG